MHYFRATQQTVAGFIRPFIDDTCPEMSQVEFKEFSVGEHTYQSDVVHNILDGIKQSGGDYCGK